MSFIYFFYIKKDFKILYNILKVELNERRIKMTTKQSNDITNKKLNHNLTNDYLFKLIFSNEKYLKYLLKVFFNYDAVNIKYLNRELLTYNFNEKAG